MRSQGGIFKYLMLGLILFYVSSQAEITWKPIAGPGKKCPLGGGFYFTFRFSETPKMGTTILKIQVFDRQGKQTAPFALRGRTDMPMMRGAHDSGEQDFKLNRKNDYLLPVNIAMPGEWEIKVTFLKAEEPFFFGSIRFDV